MAPAPWLCKGILSESSCGRMTGLWVQFYSERASFYDYYELALL